MENNSNLLSMLSVASRAQKAFLFVPGNSRTALLWWIHDTFLLILLDWPRVLRVLVTI